MSLITLMPYYLTSLNMIPNYIANMKPPKFPHLLIAVSVISFLEFNRHKK